jgi:putative NADH-flavin reductase
MVKVLVVGATGFLGNIIAKEAAQKGHKVTALVSSESQSKKKDVVQGLKSAGIEIATGSLESAQHELIDLLKTVEVVSASRSLAYRNTYIEVFGRCPSIDD